MSLFRLLEKRATQTTFADQWARDVDWGGSSTTASGVSVTASTALQSITVWSCVRLISGAIAALPTDPFVRQGGTRVPYSPRPQWMWQPNLETDPLVFWEQAIACLLLYGDAYIYVVRDDNADVLEIWLIHPDFVTPQRDGLNRELRYHVMTPDGQPAVLQPNYELVHIKGFGMPGSLTGLSPIAYAKETVGLALATQESGSRFFSQGSTSTVALEADSTLDDEALKRTARSWRRQHAGLGNAHYPLILEGGLKAKPLSIPNDQSQWLETRGFQRSEITSFFAVPPHMIGIVDDTTSWAAGIESLGIGFVIYTLTPWIVRIEQAAKVLFPPASRAFMKFNVDGMLRGDQKSRYEAYQTAIDAGFRNPDEVRALEDLPPIPGGLGASFRQPLNFGPLGYVPTPKGATQ